MYIWHGSIYNNLVFYLESLHHNVFKIKKYVSTKKVI